MLFHVLGNIPVLAGSGRLLDTSVNLSPANAPVVIDAVVLLKILLTSNEILVKLSSCFADMTTRRASYREPPFNTLT